jgi:hypothetical protein
MLFLFFYKLWRAFQYYVKAFLNLFTSQIPFFYLVTPMGEQVDLTESNLTEPTTLLVIYYTSHGTKYRFAEIEHPVTCGELMRAYRNFKVPKYRILAISVTSADDESFSLPPEEFTITGNALCTKTFHYWLCHNYFHTAPKDLFCSVIDENANLIVVPKKLTLTENEMIVE